MGHDNEKAQARYESPCGVMSITTIPLNVKKNPLRIPMRGYEMSQLYAHLPVQFVTNPHAGL